jgi:hypothetical protein
MPMRKTAHDQNSMLDKTSHRRKEEHRKKLEDDDEMDRIS